LHNLSYEREPHEQLAGLFGVARRATIERARIDAQERLDALANYEADEVPVRIVGWIDVDGDGAERAACHAALASYVRTVALSALDAARCGDWDGLALDIIGLSDLGAIEDAVAIWADAVTVAAGPASITEVGKVSALTCAAPLPNLTADFGDATETVFHAPGLDLTLADDDGADARWLLFCAVRGDWKRARAMLSAPGEARDPARRIRLITAAAIIAATAGT
jgi:hypothetical protein